MLLLKQAINNCSNLTQFMALFDLPVDSDNNPTGDPAPMNDWPDEILIMTQKRLQKQSIYAEYDEDGDGIVSDEELSDIKEIKQTETRVEKNLAQT